MDVDNSDLDMIMCQFRTMNTNDKDHLISEFKRLSNTQLGPEGCCFYLDLAEWNLNSALWAYYEYEAAAAAANSNSNQTSISSFTNSSRQTENETPEMQFLCDITIGEGESVAPNTNFIKTWRIKNTGTKRWPFGSQLKYVNGYNFSPSTLLSSTTNTNHIFANDSHIPVAIDLNELEPQQIADISVSLKSPQQCGIYQCQYRAYTSLNQPFGDPIWLLLNVEEGGLLGCIQQLNNVNMFGRNGLNEASSSNRFGTRTPANSSSSLVVNQDVNKSTVFKLDSNSNLNLVQNQNDANNVANSQNDFNLNSSIAEDEKRPDFYDDMFS